jgi:hypothetical protein
MQWCDITTYLSSTSLPPTNQILSTTAERRGGVWIQVMIPLRRFLPLPSEMVCSSVKGRLKSPISSDFLINLPTLFLPDFYEFNHMVIKKSESRTDSREVIRVCIRVVCSSFLRGKNLKCHETGILMNSLYLNRIRLVQDQIMFTKTYFT